MQNLKKKTVKGKTKAKKRKLYFGKETHNAIVEYQKEDCEEKKELLYEGTIRHSFHKLVENLIHIHGFARDPVDFEILKTDCVTFLYETIHKFKPSNGAKAFSYFNVCAKNYLIIKTNKKNKNKRRHVSIEDFSILSFRDRSSIEHFGLVPPPESDMIFSEDQAHMFELLGHIKNKAKNENERKTIEAITILFKKVDELELLNKRAIFVYLRDISGLNAKQLSVSMSNIRKYYKDLINTNDSFEMLFQRRA